jgi:hypothetical protein
VKFAKIIVLCVSALPQTHNAGRSPLLADALTLS